MRAMQAATELLPTFSPFAPPSAAVKFHRRRPPSASGRADRPIRRRADVRGQLNQARGRPDWLRGELPRRRRRQQRGAEEALRRCGAPTATPSMASCRRRGLASGRSRPTAVAARRHRRQPTTTMRGRRPPLPPQLRRCWLPLMCGWRWTRPSRCR
jgi:hypothetical protein